MTAEPEVILECFIRGIPYAQEKSRGDLEAPQKWSEDIVRQTEALPRITGPCELDVEFILPANKFPDNYRFGGDLDNYVKRLSDAMERTILRDAPGGDSSIVILHARKRKAREGEATGARILFLTAPEPF